MKIINRRASFNYQLFERYEVGVVLTGYEVLAVKKGNINLDNAHIKVMGKELYLINLVLNHDPGIDINPGKARKILMHRSEITSIASKIKAKKLTIVPTKLYTKGRLVKVEIALAKTKRKFEKRAEKKKKDIAIDMQKDLKDTL